RDGGPQVLSPPVEGGAAPAFPQATRAAGQAVEVLGLGLRGAPVVGAVRRGLRGRHPGHRQRARALVRGPCRPQVVHPSGGGVGDRRVAREDAPRLSGGPSGRAQEADGDPRGARGGGAAGAELTRAATSNECRPPVVEPPSFAALLWRAARLSTRTT